MDAELARLERRTREAPEEPGPWLELVHAFLRSGRPEDARRAHLETLLRADLLDPGELSRVLGLELRLRGRLGLPPEAVPDAEYLAGSPGARYRAWLRKVAGEPPRFALLVAGRAAAGVLTSLELVARPEAVGFDAQEVLTVRGADPEGRLRAWTWRPGAGRIRLEEGDAGGGDAGILRDPRLRPDGAWAFGWATLEGQRTLAFQDMTSPEAPLVPAEATCSATDSLIAWEVAGTRAALFPYRWHAHGSSYDGYLVEVPTGRTRARLPLPGGCCGVAFSPGGAWVAAMHQPWLYHYGVRIFDADTGDLVHEIEDVRNAEEADGPLAESSYFASATPDHSRALHFSLDDRSLSVRLPGQPAPATVELAPAGGRGPATGPPGRPRPPPRAAAPPLLQRPHAWDLGPVTDALATDQGRRLATVHESATLLVWDLTRDEVLGRHPTRGRRILGASRDATRVLLGEEVAGGILDLETGARRDLDVEQSLAPERLALSPDGETLLVAETDGFLSAVSCLEGTEFWRRGFEVPDLAAVAWHPDGASFFLVSVGSATVQRRTRAAGEFMDEWVCRLDRAPGLGMRSDRPGLIVRTLLGPLAYPPREGPREPYAGTALPAGRFDLLAGDVTALPVRDRRDRFQSLALATPQGWRRFVSDEQVLRREDVPAPPLRPGYRQHLAGGARAGLSPGALLEAARRWWRGRD